MADIKLVVPPATRAMMAASADRASYAATHESNNPPWLGAKSDGWAETTPDGKSITLCVTLPIPCALVVMKVANAFRDWQGMSNIGTLLYNELEPMRAAERAKGNMEESQDKRKTHPLNFLWSELSLAMRLGMSVGRRRNGRVLWCGIPTALNLSKYVWKED